MMKKTMKIILSEHEVEIPTGVTDCTLTAPDFVTDNEHQCVLNIAPVEGNIEKAKKDIYIQ